MSDSYSCFMWQSVMELNQHLEAAENDGGNWAKYKNCIYFQFDLFLHSIEFQLPSLITNSRNPNHHFLVGSLLCASINDKIASCLRRLILADYSEHMV